MPNPKCQTCHGLGGYPKCSGCHNITPAGFPNLTHEALRYAMQRMETIRETNPEFALDADIERCRRALDSENAEPDPDLELAIRAWIDHARLKFNLPARPKDAWWHGYGSALADLEQFLQTPRLGD